MFNLILKDIAIQKREKTFWIVILLSIANAFIFPANPGMGILMPFIGVYLIMVYSNAFDYKYNGEIMFNSMPIGRKCIVSAKYISIFIYLIISMLITIILSNILSIIGILYINQIIIINAIFIDVFLISIYYAIFFPLYYKFGYMHSRWFNFIFMAIISGVFTIINDLKKSSIEVGAPQSFQNILSSLTGSGSVQQNIILLIVSVLLIMISLKISIEIYIKKEF